MFRQTNFDPITIPVDTGFLTDGPETGIYEEQTVDFVNRTITVDGVTRPMTDKEQKFWPDKDQIQSFIDIDAASVAAQEAANSAPTIQDLQTKIDQLQAQVDALSS